MKRVQIALALALSLGFSGVSLAQEAKQNSKPALVQKTDRRRRSRPSPSRATKDGLHLYGELVKGGTECQRFRTFDQNYYTLAGDLGGFRIGDVVEIIGNIAEVSHRMQDKTISVKTIRRYERPPR